MSDNIQEITADELRKMDGKEGLVLQGCGGDLQDWLNGINELLSDAEILLNGSHFESASVFQHDGLTNLLFSFENVELSMGKLAMWRLQTHGQFGGTWLSDYVPNRLGGFVKGKIIFRGLYLSVFSQEMLLRNITGPVSKETPDVSANIVICFVLQGNVISQLISQPCHKVLGYQKSADVFCQHIQICMIIIRKETIL